jgi:hypothetical protein
MTTTYGSDEQKLLDDIEASTRRVAVKSKNIKDEANSHIDMLSDIDKGMEASSAALRAEASHAGMQE